MRARFVSLLVAALGGVVLSGCAGEAASSVPHAGTALAAAPLSAAAGRVPGPAGASSARRRTLDASPCSGAALGTDAFIAGGAYDEACAAQIAGLRAEVAALRALVVERAAK